MILPKEAAGNGGPECRARLGALQQEDLIALHDRVPSPLAIAQSVQSIHGHPERRPEGIQVPHLLLFCDTFSRSDGIKLFTHYLVKGQSHSEAQGSLSLDISSSQANSDTAVHLATCLETSRTSTGRGGCVVWSDRMEHLQSEGHRSKLQGRQSDFTVGPLSKSLTPPCPRHCLAHSLKKEHLLNK